MQDIKEITRRFNEAINYLKENKNLVSIAAIAREVGYDRATLSGACNGAKGKLTIALVKKFCETFPYISKDYILNGNGDMIVDIPVEEKSSRSFFNYANYIAEQKKTNDLILELIKSQKSELDSLRTTINLLINNNMIGKNKSNDGKELLSQIEELLKQNKPSMA